MNAQLQQLAADAGARISGDPTGEFACILIWPGATVRCNSIESAARQLRTHVARPWAGLAPTARYPVRVPARRGVHRE